jgi:pseudaminic acid synthase
MSITDVLLRDGTVIGHGRPPLIVAEMSGNHNGSLERALALVDAAADAGAHALKLQTYTADSLTLELHSGDFKITERDSPWAGRSLHELYQQAATPYPWHEAIFTRCRDRGLVCFSTPFDESAVDFLEELGAPCYKIASFEIVHLSLIRRAASTGKPLIISTGMASLAELGDAVEAARGAGCHDLILLKCTSSYPASPENSNVRTIPNMRELFGCHVGLSDHTLGIGVALAATALGAVMIEKHLTLSRTEGGVDAAFSMEPAEMRMLVDESTRAWQALGEISYGRTAAEKASVRFRRSLYVARDMAAGDAFSADNLRIVRPGYGLEPKYFEVLLGKHVSRAVPAGTPVSWDLLA